MSTATNKYRFPFIAVTTLFFLWGFITVMVDALIPRLKEVFELEYWQASLVQLAWFAAYLLISIPGGIMISRIGYKKGIVLGLGLMAAGCLMFYPASTVRMYGIFLSALFVLASGITILQVAANPYIAVLGDERGGASRLNLAQAFNSLGTTIAPMLAATYLLSDKIKTTEEISALTEADKLAYYNAEAAQVQGPFFAIACFILVLMILFLIMKLPRIIDEQGDHSIGSFVKAFKNKALKWGALGIFLYVGAEVAIGSWLTNYFLSLDLDNTIRSSDSLMSVVTVITELFSNNNVNELDAKGIVGSFVFFYWGGAMIGRFVGSWLTNIFNPANVLKFFAVGAILLVLISVSSSGLFAMWSILAVGLFNSIMFPTIFTLSIQSLGELKPQGSGILCTAIFGGAIIPLLVGVSIDNIGFTLAFIIPVLCYLYIFGFGRWAARS